VKEKSRNREEKEKCVQQVTSRSNQRCFAQARTCSPKLKSSRLSETLAAILAQVSLSSPKREFVKKPSSFLKFSPKQECGHPSETFLQPEELYLA